MSDRKALARCVAALGPGDVLPVAKLDRLARSTRDLLSTLAAIADRGAGFRSLGDPWADTTTAHGKLMITVLGGLAEFERHLILARTDEGRKRAQARGVRFGRKLKLTAHQRQEAIARREAGEILAEIAKTFNVSHSTISRLTGEIEGPSSNRWLDQQETVLRAEGPGPVPVPISWNDALIGSCCARREPSPKVLDISFDHRRAIPLAPELPHSNLWAHQ